MDNRDPAKRIPKSLGTETKLFGTYTLTDLAVGLFPAVVVILFVQVLLPTGGTVAGVSIQGLTLPLVGLAVGFGMLFVYLTPAHTSSIEWINSFLSYRRSTKTIDHDAAKKQTRIERVHPEQGVIERTDGAFIGMIQVTPPTMALATDEEWAQKAEAFRDFLNTTVEFPIQLYSTTQEFPVEAYLSHYEDRLTDPDVEANPQLASLIEHYIEWYGEALDDRRMTIRDHYVIVAVSPEEVHFEQESIVQQLAELPVLGAIVEAWLAPALEAQRAAMFDAIDERLRRVETGLREIDGCNARPVPVDDASRLIAEFWAGEARDYGDMEQVLRTRPFVGRQA